MTYTIAYSNDNNNIFTAQIVDRKLAIVILTTVAKDFKHVAICVASRRGRQILGDLGERSMWLRDA
jgi:hypothetical protein